jgi:hypothetical protein
MDRHREYIRNNPVEAGLAVCANTYPYGSFYPGMEVKAEPQGLKPDLLESVTAQLKLCPPASTSS